MFQKKKIRLSRMLLMASVSVLSVLAVALIPSEGKNSASAMYVLANNSYVAVDHPSVNVFLTDANAELISHKDGSDLLLSAGQSVTISYQDEILTTVSMDETVRELLERVEIQTSPLEMVALDFSDNTLHIEIDSEFIFYEHISSVTEHEVVYQYNSEKPDWYENVIQEGKDGIFSEVYEVIYQDGVETGRHLIEAVDTKPVTAIIEKGTIKNFANHNDPVASISTNADGSGVITLENGETVTFSEVRTMKATAYNSDEPGLSDTTASGTKVHEGVVAVDRKVIPLGTKMYIVSNDGKYTYGFAIAEDTGVRGEKVDLYMNSIAECIQFGVRNCTVYILD